jgi:hypothetical protein
MIHRAIDNILDGLANGATSLVNSISGAIRGVGKSVMGGLDKPFTDLTGKQGPHRIIDRAADGAINAGVNFVDNGIIGTARTLGKGVMSSLDHPLEQLEVGKGKIELPKLFRK